MTGRTMQYGIAVAVVLLGAFAVRASASSGAGETAGAASAGPCTIIGEQPPSLFKAPGCRSRVAMQTLIAFSEYPFRISAEDAASGLLEPEANGLAAIRFYSEWSNDSQSISSHGSFRGQPRAPELSRREATDEQRKQIDELYDTLRQGWLRGRWISHSDIHDEFAYNNQAARAVAVFSLALTDPSSDEDYTDDYVRAELYLVEIYSCFEDKSDLPSIFAIPSEQHCEWLWALGAEECAKLPTLLKPLLPKSKG